MDDARISQLKTAAPLSGSEYIPITQLQTSTNVLRTLYTDPNAFKDFVFGAAADSFCPPGLIVSYAGSVSSVDAPSGWLLCDGRSVMRSTYSKLFGKIGTTYGSVNDKSFNLPNLKGRVVMGYCDTTASTNLSSVFNSCNDDYIQYGLRFRSSASTYLSRTPSSAGNRKTWTWSGWVKRRTLGTEQMLFCAGASDTISPFETVIKFINTNQITVVINGNSGGGTATTSSAVCLDSSIWYHIVAYVDMSASGPSNKVRIYIDGVLPTLSYNLLTSVVDTQVNNNVIHRLGAASYASSGFLDGILADVNFIDGQALTPDLFGQTNACGAWVPKTYTGTYGTNGFYLNFADRSAMTAAAIGNDASPNINHFTPNNFTLNDAINFKTTPNNGAPTVSVGSVGGAFNHQLVTAQIPLQQSSITVGPVKTTPPTAPTSQSIYSREPIYGGTTVSINSLISGGLRALYGGNTPPQITLSYSFRQACGAVTNGGSWQSLGCSGNNAWASGSVTVAPDASGDVQFQVTDQGWGYQSLNISIYVPGTAGTTGSSTSIVKNVDAASALPTDITKPYIAMNYIIKY